MSKATETKNRKTPKNRTITFRPELDIDKALHRATGKGGMVLTGICNRALRAYLKGLKYWRDTDPKPTRWD